MTPNPTREQRIEMEYVGPLTVRRSVFKDAILIRRNDGSGVVYVESEQIPAFIDALRKIGGIHD